MPSFRTRLSSFIFHPASFLLALAALTYTPFFWERGFYWDEAPWTWIYYRLGPDALTQTFSTSRPFWGLIYQVMLPLVGPRPWAWQLLMVLLRWLSAVLAWVLLRRLAPQSRLPLWTAALFLVYPGLGQNFIALMYTHFYIVFNTFLLSLLLSLTAIQKRDWRWHIPALFLSIVNLLTMEYFYFLEFFRFLLIFVALDDFLKVKIRRAVLNYLPYLFVFLAVTFWRAFFFSNQNASYTYQTIEDLKTNFIFGIGKLLWNMLQAFWTTVPAAWLLPFEPVNAATLGLFTTIAAFTLALSATLLSGLYFSRTPNNDLRIKNYELLITFLLGFSAWVLGGGAFWLVGERTLPQLHFSADRFSLSFMLGSSLIVAALLGFLSRFPRLQLTLLALLIGFSVGKQFQTNATYRRDWDTQRTFFWQMSWRIPSMKPGTTVLSNDLPVTVFSDNSLSGPLNWIYSPPGKMDTILYFASVRTQEGRALDAKLQPGIDFDQNYLATVFHGNTSHIVVVNFAPPGCFRVLDPEIDPLNKLISPELRDSAFLSNPGMILEDSLPTLPDFYQPELPHGWCFFFSRAELARQSGDWKSVASLADQAYALNDHPNDPFENFVFIEGYAHNARWDEAIDLTRESYRYSRTVMRTPLCVLWERIERQASENPDVDEAVVAALQLLDCP